MSIMMMYVNKEKFVEECCSLSFQCEQDRDTFFNFITKFLKENKHFTIPPHVEEFCKKANNE